ncbi:MAG: DUF1501 domain-containing protein [Planctomycetes bacterium]|jgi:hypothetical protein|nr:DUF1501 domain-containing protein [Planctomycetota bacterium]
MNDGFAPALSTPLSTPLSRRSFLRGSAGLLGSLALPLQLGERPRPHFAPRAKHVVFVFLLGAPSQVDLFDPKPKLQELDGQPMPPSLVAGQAVDQLKGRNLVAAGSRFRFHRRGQCGMELSELLPHLGQHADRLALVRSMTSTIINHPPAQSMLMTGSGEAGRPSCGSWASYGLGSGNRDLPAFATMLSGLPPGAPPPPVQLWGNGFLPGEHHGVVLHGGAEAVRFLDNQPGTSRRGREAQLETLQALDRLRQQGHGDPATDDRIAAYQLAFRMQDVVPEAVRLQAEPAATLALYGAKAGEPSFAANCVMARRLVERGVRFVQLVDDGWDHHGQLVRNLRQKAGEVDQPIGALLSDLQRCGLLDETLVVIAGEFGRTPMNQGGQSGDRYGRDHHGKCFSIVLAGAGVRGGTVVGATDELGYQVVADPFTVHDLQATMLHLLGFDHERLVFRHRGRDFRLTDVHGRVMRPVVAG